MMQCCLIITFVTIFSLRSIQDVSGQSEVCMFEGLEADCRYRISPYSLSHITVKINVCDHPISITIHVTDEAYRIDFSHQFDSADSVIMLHEYQDETQLRVRLINKADNILNVEIDFFVYGSKESNFIHEDVDLNGQNVHCFLLNDAAKIAVGVMCGLLAVVAVLVAILVYIRCKPKKNESQTTTTSIATADEHGFTNLFSISAQTSAANPTCNNGNNTGHVTSPDQSNLDDNAS